MYYVILFQDDPDADADIRKTHMSRHLEFLEAHSGTIISAGPLFEQAGGARGGIWIVSATSGAEVLDLVHADPFWPTGLRKSFEILEWKRVFADGIRQVDF